jgi:hypothetical protein
MPTLRSWRSISVQLITGMIVIADNGIGFAKEIKKESAHYGLENMKYRAGEINCDFTSIQHREKEHASPSARNSAPALYGFCHIMNSFTYHAIQTCFSR